MPRAHRHACCFDLLLLLPHPLLLFFCTHQVNGKDSGSHFEIIFELDTRPRTTTPLGAMAGFFNALAVAQTQEGLRGSLVPWPSDR